LISGFARHRDVTTELVSQCMYTEDCPEPDVIIRTSGETRLSDFMLWQGSTSHLSFSKVLWPDLSLLDFAWIMLQYQLNYPQIEVTLFHSCTYVFTLSHQKSRQSIKDQEEKLQAEADIVYLESKGRSADDLEQFQHERANRVEKFLKYRRDHWNKKIGQLRKLAFVRL
jgi:hypothetical protein